MLDFSQARYIAIPSYPRSGNTLLRMMLFQCFGLKSSSLNPNEFGGNTALERYVGHIERDANGEGEWPPGNPEIFKLHSLRDYEGPTIYVIRNGRDAVRSLYRFYGGQYSIEDIIKGKTLFGTWSAHVKFWLSRNRNQTLVLRYEDLVNNLGSSQETLSQTLGRPIISRALPERETVAAIDGQVVRAADDRPAPLTRAQDDLFQWVNGETMRQVGYLEH